MTDHEEKDGYILNLSTSLIETKKFLIDGSEFSLLGLEHLGEEDEAEAVALFAQYSRLMVELGGASNVERGKKVAQRMRDVRVRILVVLTDAPRAVVNAWPLGVQSKVMAAAEAEMSAEEESDEPGAPS